MVGLVDGRLEVSAVGAAEGSGDGTSVGIGVGELVVD